MATITKKSIIDDTMALLTRFGRTDESRINENYLSFKHDEIRAQGITDEFKENGNIIDQTWLSDLGLLSFHKTTPADDNSIVGCACDISKTFVPQIVTLNKGDGNQDLGLVLMSTCGKKEYTSFQMQMWRNMPAEHTMSLFNYRWRINTACYVNKIINGKLKAWGVLANPEDAFFINSAPVASGSIATGVVYLVKYGQVIYNGTVYQPNTTFTGIVSITTFTTSKGVVYLNSQAIAHRETDPYPVTGKMARWMVYEICTKEFGIEKQALVDTTNDSKDDAQKG